MWKGPRLHPLSVLSLSSRVISPCQGVPYSHTKSVFVKGAVSGIQKARLNNDVRKEGTQETYSKSCSRMSLRPNISYRCVLLSPMLVSAKCGKQCSVFFPLPFLSDLCSSSFLRIRFFSITTRKWGVGDQTISGSTHSAGPVTPCDKTILIA